MDFKEIKQIVELMDEHGLTHFKLQHDDSKLELSKKSEIDVEALRQIAAASPPVVAAPSPPPAEVPSGNSPMTGPVGPPETSGEGPPPGEVEITSELVGTFYRSSSPEAEPFVQVGSEVEEDTVVCIVEAMKVMNEITASVRGTITKTLVENGTPVQYGEPLFYVKPA